MCNFSILSLEIPIQLFLILFPFPCYCCSVDLCVVSYVFRYCNSSFFAPFNIFYESSYRCPDAIFNVVESSSSAFSRHIKSVYVIFRMYVLVNRYYLSCPLDYLLTFFLLPFQEWSRVSYKGVSSDVYSFNQILVADLGFGKFLRLSQIRFLKMFLSSPLDWWCQLPLFPSTSNFFLFSH